MQGRYYFFIIFGIVLLTINVKLVSSFSIVTLPQQQRQLVQRDSLLSRTTTTTSLASLQQQQDLECVSSSLSQSSLNDNDKNNKNKKWNIQLALIDHYDSYTYNLYDMLATLCVNPPIVLNKDSPLIEQAIHQLLKQQSSNDKHDNMSLKIDGQTIHGVVLSPGPGRPSCPNDMGHTLNLIRHLPSHVPILGVCLGHQALAHLYCTPSQSQRPSFNNNDNDADDSIVKPASGGPVHGQIHAIHHHHGNNKNRNDDDIRHHLSLWDNIPSPFNVTRYHSLAVDPHELSDDVPIQPTAWYNNSNSKENDETYHSVIMALEHKTLPHFGVQFHPESIGTAPHGRRLLNNFVSICHQYKQQQQPQPLNEIDKEINHVKTKQQQKQWKQTQDYMVSIRKVSDTRATPPQVYQQLYGNANEGAIWLDSSSAKDNYNNKNDETTMPRFSIMGGMTGPHGKRIEYFGPEFSSPEQEQQQVGQVYVTNNHDGQTSIFDMGILDYLEQQQQQSIEVEMMVDNTHSSSTTTTTDDLPFSFRGGHLGYLGYEVRFETQPTTKNKISCNKPSKVPTAAFLFCDQSLVYDHWTKDWYIIAVHPTNTSKDSSSLIQYQWMRRTEQILKSITTSSQTTDSGQNQRKQQETTDDDDDDDRNVAFVPQRSKRVHLENIAKCHDKIREGESYELCLTNQFEARVDGGSRPLDLYYKLRQRNPAPFAAFMDMPFSLSPRRFSICCSSPERFLSMKPLSNKSGNDETKKMMLVEAKPIKGTAARPRIYDSLLDKARAHELQNCPKNRAENLMIVDLLRNDLSRICEVGSVHVPKLMAIESFATVHQMVSTVRGLVHQNNKKNAIQVLKSCFPGGSMTGAPKLRTMEILHDLEQETSRGPYSGCMGYLSLDGSMDMNIIIRSAVLTPGGDGYRVTIGAGGAITALSDSRDEYEEMLLKARAVKAAVQEWASQPTVGATRMSPRVNVTISVA